MFIRFVLLPVADRARNAAVLLFSIKLHVRLRCNDHDNDHRSNDNHDYLDNDLDHVHYHDNYDTHDIHDHDYIAIVHVAHAEPVFRRAPLYCHRGRPIECMQSLRLSRMFGRQLRRRAHTHWQRHILCARS